MVRMGFAGIDNLEPSAGAGDLLQSYILGPLGPDTDLRRWGPRLAE